jgi:cytoskeletal protein RodZ
MGVRINELSTKKMKKEPIDNLFADKLQQAEITPRAEAWEKLQSKMAKKEKKIVWLPYVRWSAAASVALLVGLGIWFMNDSQQPKTPTMAQTKIPTKKAISVPQIEAQVAVSQKVEIRESNSTTFRAMAIVSPHKQPQIMVQQPEIAVVKNEKAIVEPVNKKIEVDMPEPKLETIATLQPVQKPEQTVRLELSEPTEILTETIAANLKPDVTNSLPKEKRINKIFRQLKNLKNGDDVDWQEVGVKSPRLLARLNRNQEPENTNQK